MTLWKSDYEHPGAILATFSLKSDSMKKWLWAIFIEGTLIWKKNMNMIPVIMPNKCAIPFPLEN